MQPEFRVADLFRNPEREHAPLQANQLETLNAIGKLVEAGEKNIEVWGLSGTGKSVLAERLASDSRVEVVSRWSPREYPDRTSLEFHTGIPAWFGAESKPSAQIFHSGFDRAEVLGFGAQEVRHHRLSTLRNHAEQEQIAKMLEQLGLGSATIFAALTKVSSSYSVIAEIACQFTESCRLGGNSDPVAAFKVLTDSAPVDLAYVEERRLLIEQVVRQLEEYLVKCDYFNPLRRVSSMDLPDLLIFNIAENIYGTGAIPTCAHETIEWYRAIPKEVLERVETCFAVRSVNPVTEDQVYELCKVLEQILPTMRLRCWGLERGFDFPQVMGDAGRKTGLYLYRGGELEIHQGTVYLDAERDLRPVIFDSHSSRAMIGSLYCRGGRCVSDNTLVLAGGDHGIHVSHVALSLGVELALQKLGIPYEASRGVDDSERCTVDFDGTGLKSPGAFFKAIWAI